MRRGAGLCFGLLLGLTSLGSAATNVEFVLKVRTNEAWQVTQVMADTFSGVQVETAPAMGAISVFTRLAVFRKGQLLGFVRSLGVAPAGCVVGGLARSFQPADIRFGDRLQGFDIVQEPLRTLELLDAGQRATLADRVAQLGDPAFATRAAASAFLEQQGRDVLPLLKAAAASADPEVRARAHAARLAIESREQVVAPALARVLLRVRFPRPALAQQGFLGIAIADVDDGRRPGALVTQIVNDAPAARAGLQLQDVVLSIAGEVLEDSTDVLEIVSAKPPGLAVELKIRRGDQDLTVTVTLGARPIPLP